MDSYRAREELSQVHTWGVHSGTTDGERQRERETEIYLYIHICLHIYIYSTHRKAVFGGRQDSENCYGNRLRLAVKEAAERDL